MSSAAILVAAVLLALLHEAALLYLALTLCRKSRSPVDALPQTAPSQAASPQAAPPLTTMSRWARLLHALSRRVGAHGAHGTHGAHGEPKVSEFVQVVVTGEHDTAAGAPPPYAQHDSSSRVDQTTGAQSAAAATLPVQPAQSAAAQPAAAATLPAQPAQSAAAAATLPAQSATAATLPVQPVQPAQSAAALSAQSARANANARPKRSVSRHCSFREFCEQVCHPTHTLYLPNGDLCDVYSYTSEEWTRLRTAYVMYLWQNA